MFEQLVERLIQAAMQEGKFAGLQGRGRPADLRSYFETPPDVRVAHAALHGAGFAPREVELLREMADLKAAGTANGGSVTTDGDLSRLRRLELELGILRERNRGRRGVR